MTHHNITKQPTYLTPYLLAGVLAGALAAIAAVAYFLAYTAATGAAFVEISAGSTAVAAFVTTLAGALVYRGLVSFVRRPRRTFTVLGLGFGLISIVPAAATGLGVAFVALAGPLHVITAGVAVAAIPVFVAARAARDARAVATA